MREFLNVVYEHLAHGRNDRELAELDLALAPDDEAREAAINRQNMEAMKALGAITPPPPLVPRARG